MYFQDAHVQSYTQKLPSHLCNSPRSAHPGAGQLRGYDAKLQPVHMDSMKNPDPDNMDTINELREMNEVCITGDDLRRTVCQVQLQF